MRVWKPISNLQEEDNLGMGGKSLFLTRAKETQTGVNCVKGPLFPSCNTFSKMTLRIAIEAYPGQLEKKQF